MGCIQSLPSSPVLRGTISPAVESGELKSAFPTAVAQDASVQLPILRLPEDVQRMIWFKASTPVKRGRDSSDPTSIEQQEAYHPLFEVSPIIFLETLRLTSNLVVDLGDLVFLSRLMWMIKERPLMLELAVTHNPSLTFRATGHPSFFSDCLGRSDVGKAILSRIQYVEIGAIFPRPLLREVRLRESWAKTEYARSEWAVKALTLSGEQRSRTSVSLRRCTTGTRKLGLVTKSALFSFFRRREAQKGSNEIREVNLEGLDYQGDFDSLQAVRAKVQVVHHLNARGADDVHKIIEVEHVRRVRMVLPPCNDLEDVAFDAAQCCKALAQMTALEALAVEGPACLCHCLDLAFLQDREHLRHLSLKMQAAPVTPFLHLLTHLETLALTFPVSRQMAEGLRGLTRLTALRLSALEDPAHFARSVLPALSALKFLALGDEKSLEKAVEKGARKTLRNLQVSSFKLDGGRAVESPYPASNLRSYDLWEGVEEGASVREGQERSSDSNLHEESDLEEPPTRVHPSSSAMSLEALSTHVNSCCVSTIGPRRPLDINALLRAVEQPLPNLERLECVGSVSDLAALPTAFPHLKELSIVHCGVFSAPVPTSAPASAQQRRKGARNLIDSLRTGSMNNSSACSLHSPSGLPPRPSDTILEEGDDAGGMDRTLDADPPSLSLSTASTATPRGSSPLSGGSPPPGASPKGWSPKAAFPKFDFSGLMLPRGPKAPPRLLLPQSNSSSLKLTAGEADLTQMPHLRRLVLALHAPLETRLLLPTALRELDLDLRVTDGLDNVSFGLEESNVRRVRIVGLNLASRSTTGPGSAADAPPRTPSSSTRPGPGGLEALERVLGGLAARASLLELKLAETELPFALGLLTPLNDEVRVEDGPVDHAGIAAFAQQLVGRVRQASTSLRSLHLSLYLSAYAHWGAVQELQRHVMRQLQSQGDSEGKKVQRSRIDVAFRFAKTL